MITAARCKSLSLAGLMYAKVNALQAVRHHGNLSKPVTLRATDSGAQNARRNFGGSTCAGESSVSNYLPDSQSCAGGCVAHHTASYKLPQRNKKGLRPDGIPVYGYSAPAKSGAGIGVLKVCEQQYAAGFVRPKEKGIILHLAGESEASFEAPGAHTGTPIPFRPPPANLAFPAVVNSCV